jgi:CRP/FNR family transcriptional regulator
MSDQLTNKIYHLPTNEQVSCTACGLKDLCIPCGLTEDALKELDSATKYKHKFERDDSIFRAGEVATSIFAVRSGSFKTTMSNSDGAEQVTGFYLPGELVGLDGLGGNVHSCTTTALETSTVCEIPADEFDQMCANIQSLRHQTMRLIGNELSHEQHMMLVLGQMNAEERLASFLIDLSHRYKERGFSATEFNLSMSRHDLANYLGLAVETLSRLFSRFQEKSILQVNRRNIRIMNWEVLCDIAHSECQRTKARKAEAD